MTHGLLGALGALLATFGLLALALYLLKRWQPGRWGGRGVALEVLQRVQVGPRQSVALVRVADRVLVVSVTEAQMGLLAELSGAERDAALAARAESGAGAPSSSAGPLSAAWPRATLSRLGLPRFGRLFALLVLLALAAARADAAPPARAAQPRAAAGSQPAAAQTASTIPLGAGSTAPPPQGGAPALAPGLGRGLVVNPPIPPRVEIRLGEGKDGIQLSGAVGLVVFLGALTLLPALFLLMTSFTRILIVLQFLRSALGTQTTPPGQLLVAVAVLLTGLVMNPTLQEVHRSALQPYFDGRIPQSEAYARALVPFREFMLANTREQDLAMFAEMSGERDPKPAEELPTMTVMSAFVTSELRTAFQMGFVIFLPFVVVDVIVASVLMSMGMFMLPPMMISLPFKLLLFVLADGWTLVVQNLVASFHR